MDKRKELILTVGLPRSGKSTWAKRQIFPIVNPDSIRLALHGKPYIQEAEEFVWSIAYLMAKALFLAGHNVVLVDATNTTQKRREEWVKRFPGYNITHKVFNVSTDECIARARKDGREDLIPVIERMAKNIEKDEALFKLENLLDIPYQDRHYQREKA